jgi:nucleotide-binding universal stress UspA family protein
MRTLQRILLPVDFSERSAGAARYAKSLAVHFQSELILYHVLTPPQYEFGALDVGGSMVADLYRNREEQVAQELDSFLAEELTGPCVKRIVVEGDPSPSIVEYAHEQHVDLIVMPTHGYGPFRRFILGSNTAKVLHDADCPVWTGVHMEEAPPAASIPLRSVLCAIDLGPQSPQALCWAAWLAKEFGSRLTLLHVTNQVPDVDGSPGAGGIREAAREELRRLQETSNTDADLLVLSGEPAHSICTAARGAEADVLVIGRGSASGVFGRLRTNAYAIIRQSPCPVVSV